MDDPAVFLAAWEPACPRAVLARMQERKTAPRPSAPTGSMATVDDRISPLDLYVYLNARFGKPNGIQMLFKSPSSDNFIHWHYTFLAGKSQVEVMAMTTRLEIHVSDDPSVTREQWDQLIHAIKADIGNFGRQASEVRKRLEKWTLFVNPYARLRRVGEAWRERLQQLADTGLPLPAEPDALPSLQLPGESSKSRMARHEDEFKASAAAYTEALQLGVGLRLVAPVVAEAFVNLLIFLTGKDDIKNDTRLYDSVIRQPIDVRVKALHLHCRGFAEPVRDSDEQFKRFHSLMNSRNDTVHGNVDPKRLAFGTVFFEDTTPLPPTCEKLSENVLKNSLKHVEPETALDDFKTVCDFIDFLMTKLEEPVRPQVEMVSQTRDLGWREDTKRVGVLFSNWVAEGYMGW